MKYRRLGKSGILVSEIGFGAWTIALDWWGGKKTNDAEAIRMLKRAFDLGINFFETSDVYGKGRSERLIGEAFKGVNRDEVIYSTKWGYDIYGAEQVGHNELPQKHNPSFMNYALQESIKRLQTDFVDVYSLHNPKMNAIQDDTLFETLDKTRKEGKIKSYGVALGPAIGWKEEGILSMEKRDVTCLQSVYNLLEQDPVRDFFQIAEANDVGLMVRVPDASGVLTGKVNMNTVFDKNDHRSTRKKEWIAQALQKSEYIKPIANSYGWTIAELAIKFILSQNKIASVLPTVVNLEEIELFTNMSDGKNLRHNDLETLLQLYDKDLYTTTIRKGNT
jgi:aryl-alcohol dehydrogenase-like predicted oxidoreductase